MDAESLPFVTAAAMSVRTLIASERAELRQTWQEWTDARARGSYERADILRASLEAWGCLSPNYTRWNSVFEDAAHRAKRIIGRIAVLRGEQ